MRHRARRCRTRRRTSPLRPPPTTPRRHNRPRSTPAGEHAADEHAGEEHSVWAGLLWPTVNFLILVGGLWWFLKEPFVSYLRDRHSTIRKELVEAANIKAAAAAQLAEIDAKLRALPGEIEALRTRGAEEIAAEEQRIAAMAVAERERLLEQTRREIELQVRLAKRELVEHTADLAVQLASDQLQQQITPADQERLVGRYLDQAKITPAKRRTEMSLSTSATRYAKALLEVAIQESDPARIEADLSEIVGAMTSSSELRRAMLSPAVPQSARVNIVRASAIGLGSSAGRQAAGHARGTRPPRAAARPARGLSRAAAGARTSSAAALPPPCRSRRTSACVGAEPGRANRQERAARRGGRPGAHRRGRREDRQHGVRRQHSDAASEDAAADGQ